VGVGSTRALCAKRSPRHPVPVPSHARASRWGPFGDHTVLRGGERPARQLLARTVPAPWPTTRNACSYVLGVKCGLWLPYSLAGPCCAVGGRPAGGVCTTMTRRPENEGPLVVAEPLS
jgi:hypothetical protein